MGPTGAVDVVVFVTNPAFAGRRSAVGDYLDLALFKQRYPELRVQVVAFNDPATQVEWDGSAIRIAHPSFGTVDPAAARLVVYMPVSFEPEDVAMHPPGGNDSESVFAHRQWRVLGEFLELLLSDHPNCINDPRRARFASNKPAQLRRLLQAGLSVLPIAVSGVTPCAIGDRLVRKNLSEAAILPSGDISSTRLAGTAGDPLARPAIFQAYVEADHEMRFYVMGDEVIPVRLRRRLPQGVVDVREMQATMEDVSIAFDYERHHGELLEACRLLGLRYAVIDAMPKDGRPWILEVNPNGVWTNLPLPLAQSIARSFHEFLRGSLAGVS
jgi:hypothetical protein